MKDLLVNSTSVEDYLTSNYTISRGNALTEEEDDWLMNKTYLNSTAIFFDYFYDDLNTTLYGEAKSCRQQFKSYFETDNNDKKNAVLDKMALSLCTMTDTQFLSFISIVHKCLGTCIPKYITHIWTQ